MERDLDQFDLHIFLHVLKSFPKYINYMNKSLSLNEIFAAIIIKKVKQNYKKNLTKNKQP